MTRVVAGLDLGSTTIKLLLADADAGFQELAILQRSTPWRSVASGRTELDPAHLVGVLEDLFAEAAEALATQLGVHAAVEALAIAGMGETGVLLDAAGQPRGQSVAWFDPRGEQQLLRMRSHFGDDFPARTGLPLGVQVSVVKLADRVARGGSLAQLRWLNLPDFVAHAMGAPPVADLSLTARTGLLDLESGRPWAEMLGFLGAGEGFLPPLLASGAARGSADAAWLPRTFRGAPLSVAGHDHLVSAAATTGTRPGRYHASLGTAEVLVQPLLTPPDAQARVRLSRLFINTVRHVISGQWVLIAGMKTGLLQRRVLQVAGVRDALSRAALDSAVLALPPEGRLAPDAVEVRGARNDDGVLHLDVRSDEVSPADLFLAVLNHGNDELKLLLAAMHDEVPTATSTLLTGGWARMRSVQRARRLVLPDVEVSERDQDTAHATALAAARSLAS